MSLRIVAGSLKRRLIDEVPGESTRPTTDRNRESLFNILGQFFEGGTALDLCAGTGALGIECLSRGMTHATFVEQSPIALRVLKSNLRKLSLEEQSVVHGVDVLRFLQTVDQSFDCILADPPYQAGLYEEIIRLVGARGLLTNDGTLVLEADKTAMFSSTADLTLKETRIMGNTQFAFFHRRSTS